jgi:hypothetical protein
MRRGLHLKISLAVLVIALLALAWRVTSVSAELDEQKQQVHALKKALSEKSTQDALAVQEQCSNAAMTFVFHKADYKPGQLGFVYENHFNAKMKKCFVLVSYNQLDKFFLSIDLYDAVENKHYGAFNGFTFCNDRNPGRGKAGGLASKCDLNSGRIWVDGNDTRRGEVIGFQGSDYGPGVGDEHTCDTFRERLQPFMTE